MKSLTDALNEYLGLRRRMGFLLVDHEESLKAFVRFLDARGARFITSELAVEWARLPGGATSVRHARRLAMARDFAKYVLATDPRTEVPPQGLLPNLARRPQPYIYTPGQIAALIRAAAELQPCEGLRIRRHTYSTLFGLIAATGMRVREALSLECRDVDLEDGVITVRESKFCKTRLLPVHRSTLERLREYALLRDGRVRLAPSGLFFVSDRRTRLQYVPVNYTFLLISRRIGLRRAGAPHGPRLHDLRHTFAVRVLADWYRSGGDPARCLPLLSTYLGHANVNNTYWYLSATPDLLGAANERLERLMGGQA
ncbi:MAG: tyrosine-type recombinase/integrase [Kiritimatiellae bacterium]|jgi:integrase|nr:tyrosine-type recombinase/integrase [Kiritimatiellia bacterium]